jgi:hypothetical protein
MSALLLQEKSLDGNTPQAKSMPAWHNHNQPFFQFFAQS